MGEAVDNEQPQENPGKKRQRTQIAFPYTDLQRAVDLCAKLAELGGAGPVELTQLAAAMNQTADGGTFRGRISAARMFGLIEYGGETAQLAKLGEDVLDPNRSPAAKAEALLRVPLYEKLYQQYQGYQLPPAAALERQMVIFGLPQKQVERARQAFASSVDAAGFINENGRFIKPVISAGGATGEKPKEIGAGGGGGGGGSRSGAGGLTPPGGAGGTGSGFVGHRTARSASEMLLELLDPEDMTEEETKAVWTLLLYAKKPKKVSAPAVADADTKTAADQ